MTEACISLLVAIGLTVGFILDNRPRTGDLLTRSYWTRRRDPDTGDYVRVRRK